MNKELKSIIDTCVSEIRYVMDSLIEEIGGDFTGWCELGSMLVFRLTRELLSLDDNVIILGTFKGNGHFWNQINGVIVDSTVDQFGRLKTGLVHHSQYKYYSMNKEIVFDEDDLKHMTESDGVYQMIYSKLKGMGF